MGLIAKALVVFISLTVSGGGLIATDVAETYSNYYAATRALDRGDCGAAVKYLDAFLVRNPDVREDYPDFYFQIRLVMGQCSGTIGVRGVEGESGEIDPLPDHPPMEK